MSEKSVEIKVDEDVTLEGRYAEADNAPGAAIVLHPHPQYGGSMDNNVVDALCDGAARAGWSCLRFNFRGVGASGGVHGGGYAEASDVAAAAQWLQDQQKCTLALLGYSFGSLVGSLAASQIAEVDRALWVAPPLVMGNLSQWPEQNGPCWIIAGSQDEFTAVGALQAYANELGARGFFKLRPGVDHFWWGQESALSDLATRLLRGEAPE